MTLPGTSHRVVMALVAMGALAVSTSCKGRASSGDSPPEPPSVIELDLTIDAPFRDDDALAPYSWDLDLLDAAKALPHGTLSREGQFDYSGQQADKRPFLKTSPERVEDVQAAMQFAAAHDLTVRVHGHGHSMNGASLVQPGELRIDTVGLRTICRLEDTLVRVGAGVGVSVLNDWLSFRGLGVAIYNDGGPGPSAGGYLAAGGFGALSGEYGGYWNTVQRIELVDAHGDVHVLTPDDDDFLWMFGSAGQLGVFTSVDLRIRHLDPSAPVTESFAVGECEQLSPYMEFPVSQAKANFLWWTGFVPPESSAQIHAGLAAISAKHPSLDFMTPYEYSIPHKGRWAPLVTPVAGDVHAIGVWIRGTAGPSSSEQRADVAAFHREVVSYYRKAGVRQYLQAELAAGPEAWKRNLGDEIYAAFHQRKQKYDPAHRFGRGLVFDYVD